jgi:hypothetical protein
MCSFERQDEDEDEGCSDWVGFEGVFELGDAFVVVMRGVVASFFALEESVIVGMMGCGDVKTGDEDESGRRMSDEYGADVST